MIDKNITWVGGLSNTTNYLSVPYYVALGFFDGAFNATFIQECRLHSIRFGANVTLLAWNAQILYGVDHVFKYATQTIRQFYPFSYYCYYQFYNAIKIATSENYFNQSIVNLLVETTLELDKHTDEVRRIIETFTGRVVEQAAQGKGLKNKDWYVFGRSLGIILKLLAVDDEEITQDDYGEL